MRGEGRRNLPSSSSISGSKKLECSSRVYKNSWANEVDIISNLPEHILHHIFSFVDMKQAIQTCILSRRWRYFWGSLPTLKFSYNKANRKTDWNEFMDFVDRVLMFRSNSSSIDEFTLVSYHNIYVTDRLNTWILASVIRNVQQLTLRTHFPDKFHFHQCLFTCKSLTKLVVDANYNGVSLISLPDSVTLPRLKTLYLNLVKFEDEDSTNQLFSSCPILESLTIHNCEFPHINVNISSPLLQHLRLKHCRTRSNALDLGPVHETNFQLCAPNLISFVWYNEMSIHCSPKNLSSLVKADVKTHAWEDSKLSKENVPFMVNILRGLHNVEDLELSAEFLEVITRASDLLDSQPMKFSNLRCLELEGKWRTIHCIHAISYLLKISPNIETLFIHDWGDVGNADTDLFWGDAGNADTDLLDVQPTQFCNLRCLKICTFLSRDSIYVMACLLKICSNTETLSYTVYELNYSYDDEMDPYCDETNSVPVIGRDYWEAGLSLEGSLNHVKCFKLRNVTARINELEFIEILLKNSMKLEKLLIVFETTYSDTNGRQIKFSEKVLTFPRASPSVVILFK